MFYGLIILCAVNASEINKEECMVYASPMVYESRPICYEAIKQFLLNEEFIATQTALGMVPRNAKCVDLTARDIQGLQT